MAHYGSLGRLEDYFVFPCHSLFMFVSYIKHFNLSLSLFLSVSLSLTHTHTQTLTLARTHAHTHTHTQRLTHTPDYQTHTRIEKNGTNINPYFSIQCCEVGYVDRDRATVTERPCCPPLEVRSDDRY